MTDGSKKRPKHGLKTAIVAQRVFDRCKSAPDWWQLPVFVRCESAASKNALKTRFQPGRMYLTSDLCVGLVVDQQSAGRFLHFRQLDPRSLRVSGCWERWRLSQRPVAVCVCLCASVCVCVPSIDASQLIYTF